MTIQVENTLKTWDLVPVSRYFLSFKGTNTKVTYYLKFYSKLAISIFRTTANCTVHVCARALAHTRMRSLKCTCMYTCLDMCMSGRLWASLWYQSSGLHPPMGQPRVSVLRTQSTYVPALGISFQDSILLVFEIQFFLAGNSQIHLGWAMSLRDPPISTFPCCGYKCLLLHLSSCTDVRDGTQVFMPTCTSPTDLSPHTNAHSFCNLHRILHSLTTQRLVLREQVQ